MDSLRLWWFGLSAGVGLALIAPAAAVAQDSFEPFAGPSAYSAAGSSGGSDSLTSSIKRGFDKLTDAVTPQPKVEVADDPTSLSSKSKPGIELHLAVARLYAESGKLGEAADHYQKALKSEPNNLAALLAYARLLDRTGDPDEARTLYLRAVKAHPKDASALNNLGLFYAGHGMPNDAGAAFARAIQLRPENPKYRNNIARLLVAMDRPKEALEQLLAVHRQPVAYYNMGYLLESQGQVDDAAAYFAAALQADPSLLAARQGLERLQTSVARRSTVPGNGDLRSGDARLSRRPTPPAVEASPNVGPPPSPSQVAPSAARAGTVVVRPSVEEAAPPWMQWDDMVPGGVASATDRPPAEEAPLPPAATTPVRLPAISPARSAERDNLESGDAPLPPSGYGPKPALTAPLPPSAPDVPPILHLPPVD